MNGPGKYDEQCTYVREQTQAEGAIVLVLNGRRGTGFSVQGPLYVHELLADVLEHLAGAIRKSLAEQTRN